MQSRMRGRGADNGEKVEGSFFYKVKRKRKKRHRVNRKFEFEISLINKTLHLKYAPLCPHYPRSRAHLFPGRCKNGCMYWLYKVQNIEGEQWRERVGGVRCKLKSKVKGGGTRE